MGFWLVKVSPVMQCFAVSTAVGVSNVPVHRNDPFALRILTAIAAPGVEESLLPRVIAKAKGGNWRVANRMSFGMWDRTPQEIRFCMCVCLLSRCLPGVVKQPGGRLLMLTA